MDKRSYNKRQVGTEKENLAAEYLKKKGYFIIEKNYRVRQGEIDLVAEGQGCLVFAMYRVCRGQIPGEWQKRGCLRGSHTCEDTANLEDCAFLPESEENKH